MSRAVRKSVPLEAVDLDLVARLRLPGSVEREAVEHLTGTQLPPSLSEAQSLSLLMSMARTLVAEQVLDMQYARYAAHLDAEDIEFGRLNRERRTRLSNSSHDGHA